MQFPDSLPILPVKDNLLLTGGQVTQKLIEPRYINMVLDSLASKDRMIGVCIIDNSKKYVSKDEFYNIGCAGKITKFEEMVDGSFFVVLTGYCRFRLLDEVPTMRQYRRFSLSFDEYKDDLIVNPNTDIDKSSLTELIKEYADKESISMDWEVLKDMPAFNIITFFSMHLPFNDIQKQKLLEAKTVEDRAFVLSDLINKILEK
jgi:Lon protease-like protein